MNRVQVQLIKECLDSEHQMSVWEWDFINNIADKDDDYELSEKQNKVLNEINSRL